MPRQSHALAILLTRPLAQSQRFARSLRAASDVPLHITISPLMQVAFLVPELPPIQPKGLIFSSETAVAAYVRLPDRPVAPAWCIGQRTRKAADHAGLTTVFCAPDASHLLAHMVALHPDGPFLHLRGADSQGDIAASLAVAGIPADQTIIYAQHHVPLAPHALRLLQRIDPIIVPLFSARSAQLFCDAATPHAPIRFVALSGQVAGSIPPDRPRPIVVSPRPDAQAMLETVMNLLRVPPLP